MNDIDDMTESMLLTTGESQRALWPRNCKNDCAGIATGKCQAIGCKGYRRRNLGENDDRDLLSGAAFTCTQQVNYINAGLTKLVTQNLVQADCKTLLSKPRNITCFDDVIYGVVESFKLWDTDEPQQVIIDNYMGQDVQKGREFTIEVITNDCVDFLKMTLTGPNGYFEDQSEHNHPFAMFGGDSSIGQFYGNQLPIGQYELTALPDGFVDKKKVLKFNVVPGTVSAVKLWNTVAKTVLNSNFTGGNVCSNMAINFEVIYFYAQTSKITLTCPALSYSKSNTETGAPFSIFNNDSNKNFYGKTLQKGLYTLTIYPDEVVSSYVKTIQFNVINCP